MKRNRVVLVTSVSTAMLGAGWAAGLVGAAVTTQDSTSTTDATETGSPATDTSTQAAPPSTATADATVATPDAATTTDAVSGTFDGALVNTREGAFQAGIVVENGIITEVNVLVGGDNRGESVDINRSALPTLQQRVLSAQSWDVQGISGATYTVDGFTTSVKDAMAQAGI